MHGVDVAERLWLEVDSLPPLSQVAVLAGADTATGRRHALDTAMRVIRGGGVTLSRKKRCFKQAPEDAEVVQRGS